MLKKLQNLAGVKVLDQDTMINLRGGKSLALFACTPVSQCMVDANGGCFCCPTGFKPCDTFWPSLSCIPKSQACA